MPRELLPQGCRPGGEDHVVPEEVVRTCPEPSRAPLPPFLREGGAGVCGGIPKEERGGAAHGSLSQTRRGAADCWFGVRLSSARALRLDAALLQAEANRSADGVCLLGVVGWQQCCSKVLVLTEGCLA